MVLAFSVAVMAAEKYAVSTKQLLLHHNKSSHIRAKAEQNPLIDAFISLSDADCQPLKALGVKVNARFGDMVTAQVPLSMISEVAALPMVRQIAVSEQGEANTDVTIPTTDVAIAADGTHYGLPTDYTGKGVVVGIIDSGFDFNHKAFQDADGNTRIKRVYMPGNRAGKLVVIDGDTLPGSEFTAADVPHLTSDLTNYSHGTHCLGIAAGTRVGQYGGMAPQADIVVCALGYSYSTNQVAIANCARYILEYAKSVNLPCVISTSLGFQGGPHDGTSAYCQAISTIADEGAVVCVSVGNSAGYNHVLKVAQGTTEPVGSTLPNAVDSVIGGVAIDTWSHTADAVGVKLLLIDPASKKIVYSTPVIQTDRRLVAGIDFEHDTDFSMRLNQFAQGEINILTSVGLNGHFNIRASVELKKRDGGKHYLLGVQFYNQNGAGHTSWLWGSTFSAFTTADGQAFVSGTQNGCINDNATARGCISVGNYIARNSVPMLSGGTYTAKQAVVGDIYQTSSFGTDEAGTVHPMITAPGHMVISALNTYNSDYYNALPQRLSFSSPNATTGKTNYWGPNTGTSMSAPTVAGIVALWLQANPRLSVAEIKQMLTSTAISDSFVERNSERFGGGKVNALGGFPEVKLPLKVILSSDKYGVGKSYNITDKILRVLRVSTDGQTLYTRSDGESFNTSLLNWMAIDLPRPLSEMERKRFDGAWLYGVRGVLTDRRNPRMTVAERPMSVEQLSKPIVPTITPANYHGTQNGHYFVKPKAMEVDTLQYAMWDEEHATLMMPPYAPLLGIERWQGEAKVDFSHFEGEMPSLTDGFTYKMVVLTQVDENGGYIACPLHNIQEQSHRLIIGDVNSDGQLNVTDVTSLINHILGTATFPTAACDLTADGTINVSDTTALINLILSGFR